MRRTLISTIKSLVYELTPEMSNDLRLKILGNWELLEKSPNLAGDSIDQSPFSKFKFGSSSQKVRKSRYQSFFSPVHFCWTCSKCFVRGCLNKQVFSHNLAQSLPNFNFLTFSFISRLLFEI